MSAVLTPRALAVIADSGETGEPIFRTPCSVGSGGGDLLKDLRWRIADVREMLMSSWGDRRIYGCDEWSTPVVNLQRAIDKIDRSIEASDVPVGISASFPEDSQIIAAFEGIERSVSDIPEGVEGYLDDLSEAIDGARVVVQALRTRAAIAAATEGAV